MNNSLTVQEQMHDFWKIITIISGIISAILLLIFLNLTDPFWIGIARLGSFIFFGVTVLGSLKLMNGPLKITVSSTDELLLVSYQKKEKIVQEEEFQRGSIKRIIPRKPKSNLQYYLQPDSKTFKINFDDSDRDLYLFQFSGRPLLFSSSSQKAIKDFFHELGIDV